VDEIKERNKNMNEKYNGEKRHKNVPLSLFEGSTCLPGFNSEKKKKKKEKNCPPYSVHMLAAAWRWFLAASRSTGSNNVAAKRWPSLWGLERSYPRENYSQTVQRRCSSFSWFRPPINRANVRLVS
jgi:hypothetical protein